MPRKRWIKLWTQETLYGTTSQELKLDEQAIWFKLLALAGDSPEPGKVEVAPGIPMTDEQIAAIFKCPSDVWLRTKQRLQDPDVDKIYINEDIINIQNWEKYQSEYERTKKYHNTEKPTRKSTNSPDVENSVEKVSSLPDQTKPEEEEEEEEGKRRGRGNSPELSGEKPAPSLTGLSLIEYFNKVFPEAFGRKPDSREIAQLRDLGKEISSAGGATAKQVYDAFKEAAAQNKLHISYIRKILHAWLGLERGSPA